MAVQANGRLKKGKKAGKEANFDSQMNGHVVGRTYKQERPRKSVMGTMNSVIARYYSILFMHVQGIKTDHTSHSEFLSGISLSRPLSDALPPLHNFPSLHRRFASRI